jgi:hypothetical protein
MSAVPPIYKAFEALSRDDRFAGLGLEFSRKVDSAVPSYEILVKTSPRGDAAAYATLIAALGDFARKHNLDSEMQFSSVTLTPRG